MLVYLLLSEKFRNFVAYSKSMTMIDEMTLREHAKGYDLCFCGHCPRHEHCLRWQVGQYVSPSRQTVTCVNPLAEHVATDQCPAYRDDMPQRVAKGMVYFYDEMPRKLEVVIKAALIARFTRVGYYNMRKGLKPITADKEQVIENVCRAYGWTQPLQFDKYVNEIIW